MKLRQKKSFQLPTYFSNLGNPFLYFDFLCIRTQFLSIPGDFEKKKKHLLPTDPLLSLAGHENQTNK